MTWQTPEQAAVWQAMAARRDAAMAATTAALFELADIQPGFEVLDCGCGSGEMTAALADVVGPSGSVLAVDTSERMLDLARRTATRANVEFKHADLQRLELGGRRFDAAVSRNVIMLLPDEQRALRRLRAALRPGGRLACSVWSRDRSARFSIPADVLREFGHEPPPEAAILMVRRLGTEDLLAGALQGAGFGVLEVRHVAADLRFDSLSDLLDQLAKVADEFLEGARPGTREAVRRRLEERLREHETAGVLTLPGEQVVAAGLA